MRYAMPPCQVLLSICVLSLSAPLFGADAHQPRGLFLTWQEDPLRSMVVDWHTAQTDEPGVLTYRIQGSDGPWQSQQAVTIPFPFGERTIHRVALRDLTPGTTYAFRMEGYAREYSFRTMPADAMEPIVVALGGDTLHYPRSMMDGVNRQAMRYDPEFIVWGGDLAYADGLPERVNRWFDWFDSIYETLITEKGRVVPIVVGIGNHEVRGGYIWRTSEAGEAGYRQTDQFRTSIAPYFYTLFAFPGQPGYGVLDFGSYLSLIILDSDHSNPIPGEQTEWLQKVLSERQHNVLHQLPIYHHPGYPSARNFNDRASRRVRTYWMPLFEQYGVRFGFEHHDHTYKRTLPMRAGEPDESGIVYFGDGAWGVNVRPVRPVGDYGYMARVASKRHAIIMTLQGRHLSFEVICEDGEIIDRFPEKPSPAKKALPRP